MIYKVKSQKSRQRRGSPKAAKVKSILTLITYVLLTVTFNFALLIFNLRQAYAQSLSLSINPPIVEIIIKPGKTITQVFTLQNKGSPVVLTPYLKQFGEKGLIDDPSFIPEPWLKLANYDLAFNKPALMQKSDQKQFILSVEPPPDIAEQDYYRALVFTTEPNPAGQDSQSQFSQTIGSIILIRVTSTGIVRKEASITKFTLPQIHDSFSPLKTLIEVKNTGETFFRPIGTISLTGPFGTASFDIVPNIILVDQVRKIVTEQSNFNFPTDQPTLVLPGFYLGKYQLSINFTLDKGTVKITDSKAFYALPVKGVLVLIVLLAFVILIRLKRREKAKKTHDG